MAWSLEERARRMPVRALDGGAVGPVDNGVGLPELVDVAGREPGRRGPQVVDGVVRGSLTEEPVADPNGTWRRRARRFDRTGPWPVRADGNLLTPPAVAGAGGGERRSRRPQA